MPYRVQVPCKHPGCARLIPSGIKYCDIHRSLHPEEKHSASSRGYGSQWRKASKEFLQCHPLCVICREEGKFVKATVVDHIIPHRGDQEFFWDRNNWQSLCKKHHDQKIGREDSEPKYKYTTKLLF